MTDKETPPELLLNDSEQTPLDADAQEYQRRIAAISEQRRVREAKVAEADKERRDEMAELAKRLAKSFDREAHEHESREATRAMEDKRNAERAKKGLPPDYSLTESMQPKAKVEMSDLANLSVEQLSPKFMSEASQSWGNKDFSRVADLAFHEAARLEGDYGDHDDQIEDMIAISRLVGSMEGKSFEDFLAAFIKLERFGVYKKG